jgi:ribosomal protein S3AE
MVKVKKTIYKIINKLTTNDKKKIEQFITKTIDSIDDAREKGIFIGLKHGIAQDIVNLGAKALPVLNELLKKESYSATTKKYIRQIITDIIKNKARKNTPGEFTHELLQSEKKY